ncbi:MAG: matrixin family metalloprotease [Planctomycetota bacterium]|nr:matrixin family metalloprotease [Planctomycetota bacterium]
MSPEHRSQTYRQIGVPAFLFLVLLLLGSCRAGPTGAAAPEPEGSTSRTQQAGQIEPAFVYPYSVLDRLTGSDGILWQHDRTDCPVDPERAESIIEKALARWNLPGTCSFRRAEADEDAALTIGWRSSDHGSPCYRFGIGEALVAHRVTSPRSGDPTPHSIHLNIAVSWNLGEAREQEVKPRPGLRLNTRPRPRLEAVIVHEAGHVLGLGHVVKEGSVMRALQGDATDEPGPPDLMGVYSLYGGGGEETSSADLLIHCIAPDGTLHQAAPIIRGLAPPEQVRVHAADLDGDDREELLLLGVGRPVEGTGLLILTFEEGALLNSSLGPFPGMFDGKRPLAVGRTASGDAVLAQPVGQQGRYHAVMLMAGRPPLRLLPPQQSWVSVGGGGGDEDGDGLLDSVIIGLPGVRNADLDGDGIDEMIRRGVRSN